MAVTYRAATSTTATFPSRSVSVAIRGSTLETCADAAPIARRKHKSQSPRSIFIVHLYALSGTSALQVSGQSPAPGRGITGPHDLRKEKLAEKSMLVPAKGSETHPLDRRQRPVVDRHRRGGSAKPGKQLHLECFVRY